MVTFLYNKLRNKYITHYFPDFRELGINNVDALTEEDEVNKLVYDILQRDKPCMISRFGSTEMAAYIHYRKGHPLFFLRRFYPFWVRPFIKESMKKLSGFFPCNNTSLSRFADLEFEAAKECDILGSWINNEVFVDKYMHYKKVFIRSLNPFWSKNPWTKALENKSILIVHPFAETIMHQYSKRKLLFDNPDILPQFASLRIVKAVQSLNGSDEFPSWFDALKYMEDDIDSEDYDIAIIGCGAYGMPLAAHCKRMGKKAVHLGGATQLLFGIRGKRWEEDYYGEKYKKMLSNPYWVRPSLSETPSSAKDVENSCYW